MQTRFGVVMDPIASINPKKDSTLAMMVAAQQRGWEIDYIEPSDLFVKDGVPFARVRIIDVRNDLTSWFTFKDEQTVALEQLDVIMMRRDPPFDMDYIYVTHILELAERRGALVVNKPNTLRGWNEKMATALFADCTPPTLVTCDITRIRTFAAEHGHIVVKPLDGMGGASIFRLTVDDPNFGVVLETLTNQGRQLIMAQRFIPEISAGDKRILMVDGEPVPHALARIPAPGESRGNLARGARGEGVALSARDRWICEQVGPALRSHGLLFVGLDVIGDYLTEINVTSPTGIKEIDKIFGTDIAGMVIDSIERKV